MTEASEAQQPVQASTPEVTAPPAAVPSQEQTVVDPNAPQTTEAPSNIIDFQQRVKAMGQELPAADQPTESQSDASPAPAAPESPDTLNQTLTQLESQLTDDKPYRREALSYLIEAGVVANSARLAELAAMDPDTFIQTDEYQKMTENAEALLYLLAEKRSPEQNKADQQEVIEGLGINAQVEGNEANVPETVGDLETSLQAQYEAKGEDPQSAKSKAKRLLLRMAFAVGETLDAGFQKVDARKFLDAFFSAYDAGMSTWDKVRERGGNGEVVLMSQVEQHFRHKKDLGQSLYYIFDYATKADPQLIDSIPQALRTNAEEYRKLPNEKIKELFVELTHLMEKDEHQAKSVIEKGIARSMKNTDNEAVINSTVLDDRTYKWIEELGDKYSTRRFDELTKRFKDASSPETAASPENSQPSADLAA